MDRIKRLTLHLNGVNTGPSSFSHSAPKQEQKQKRAVIEDVPLLENHRPDVENILKTPGGPRYLDGNFAPTTHEGFWENLSVIEGEIPRLLNGSFLRIGPNNRFKFDQYNIHPFDGDGMIHSVTLVNGKASYTKRYVQTYRLRSSIERGYDVGEFGEMSVGNFGYFPHVMDSNQERMGKANTNMIFHNHVLLALEEQDKPYAVRVDLDVPENHLRTIDRLRLSHHVVTAHPKVDSKTGELIFFGYSVDKPEVYVSVADKNGVLLRTLTIQLPNIAMMHDCVITENYTILFDMNLTFDLQSLNDENHNPWQHLTDRPARIGLMQRHATSGNEMIWLDTKPCGLFHFANAWEEKENGFTIITIIGARMEKVSMHRVEDAFYGKKIDNEATASRLYMWKIDVNSKKIVLEKKLSHHHVDFVQVDQDLCGYKTRFIYGARFVNHDLIPKLNVGNKHGAFYYIDGILKFDLQTEQVFEFDFKTKAGNVGYGGEAVFGRTGNISEDDGFLTVLVHDEITGDSEFQIIHAKSMKLHGRLEIPERVPYGFHSYWLDAKKLQ